MISYRKTVFIGLKSVDNVDEKALQAAIDSQSKTGSLNVTASARKNGKGELDGYNITGDAIAAEQSDFANVTATQSLDSRIGELLGDIGRVADDDPVAGDYKAGEPIDSVYLLNHGGLPLAFGDAIKATFAKRSSGRGGPSLASLAAAFAWALKNAPQLVASSGTVEGQRALLDAFAEATA